MIISIKSKTMGIFIITLFLDKGFKFLLEEDVPTMLHGITQCIEILTMKDLTHVYIKVTYT